MIREDGRALRGGYGRYETRGPSSGDSRPEWVALDGDYRTAATTEIDRRWPLPSLCPCGEAIPVEARLCAECAPIQAAFNQERREIEAFDDVPF